MKLDDLVKPHVEAYEALFKRNIFKRIVEKTKPLFIDDFRLEIDEFRVEPPSLPFEDSKGKLFPRECRLTNESYKGKIYLKVSLYYGDDLIKSETKEIHGFPIMVKSMYCNLNHMTNLAKYGEDEQEPGGFFIINGLDKLVRFHIMPKRNYPFALIRTQHNKIYSEKLISIRSLGDDELGHMNYLLYSTDGNVYLKLFQRVKEFHIPLVVVLKALVNTTDLELYTLLDNDPFLTTALRKTGELNVFSRKECVEYIGSRFRYLTGGTTFFEAGTNLIDTNILPHLEDNQDKFNFLLISLKKLYAFIRGEIVPDDPDSPSSHELLTETQLFASIFKDRIEDFKKNFNGVYQKLIKTELEKKRKIDSETEIDYMTKKEKIVYTFKTADYKTFARGFHTFLSSGNVTHNHTSDLLQNAGFVILAEKINYYRYISHFRSVNRGTFFQQVRTTTVRKLRPESWGFMCPIHTPDGTPCGLLTHLTTSVELVASPDSLSLDVFYENGVVPVMRSASCGVPVFLDGRLLGHTESPDLLIEKLREYRRKNNSRFEVVFNNQDKQFGILSVHNGIGRFTRPVFHKSSKIVDWIGIMEQVFLNINLKNQEKYAVGQDKDKISHTPIQENNTPSPGITPFEYEEIDNQNLFSLVASLTPFSEYNQSPRSMYQCQMAKQSMGIPAHNLSTRTDTKLYTINYTQHPIVKNRNYSVLQDYPLGINCIVAVLSYTAYDMEDAMVINKGSMERGLFCGYVYKTDKIELPRDAIFSYLPNIGHKLKKTDILYTYTDLTGKEYTVNSGNYEGYVVDTVDIFKGEYNVCANIKFRISRNPNIGDKFCSRHGQKGVCSMHWPTIDMPFTEGGIVPDIIINPHAFPSRMTIGMLIESMAGKVGACVGEFQDATAFEERKNGNIPSSDTKVNSIGEDLIKNGFNYYGNEPMYSGVTGNEFMTDIFIGVVFYQRLRHMVNDKFQVRSTGAVISTTRQPVGGRKKLGGVRFGEMERDALIAHGTSYLLNDRLIKCSDHHIFTYCTSCKSILFTMRNKCTCGGKVFTTVELPFVFKYLCAELMAMNIKVELELKHPT
ncbi:DNA-directed RNA polymerase I subunit RPA2 [Nosema bombycis CQ1]|uniref:DNA-directed RNA polymerase subunit beta n=1 Tax=Nosema bombycis (strain CQ1 / CVCC 102059) TaxID=578461 RepID=R0KPL9_NOSB1|nr:DNA-directed RNA polymerase I subunit RPA2 [Nosema bombycis CQ1]|eukprot:EOB12651.1 DNA-directed RNA polymerase I subunit RPA2 [Nosema bombycis CQ1]